MPRETEQDSLSAGKQSPDLTTESSLSPEPVSEIGDIVYNRESSLETTVEETSLDSAMSPRDSTTSQSMSEESICPKCGGKKVKSDGTLEFLPVSRKSKGLEVLPISKSDGHLEILAVSKKREDLEVSPISKSDGHLQNLPVSNKGEDLEVSPMSKSDENLKNSSVSNSDEDLKNLPESQLICKCDSEQDETKEEGNKTSQEPDKMIEEGNKTSQEPDKMIEEGNKTSQEPDKMIEEGNKTSQEPDKTNEGNKTSQETGAGIQETGNVEEQSPDVSEEFSTVKSPEQELSSDSVEESSGSMTSDTPSENFAIITCVRAKPLSLMGAVQQRRRYDPQLDEVSIPLQAYPVFHAEMGEAAQVEEGSDGGSLPSAESPQVDLSSVESNVQNRTDESRRSVTSREYRSMLKVVGGIIVLVFTIVFALLIVAQISFNRRFGIHPNSTKDMDRNSTAEE